MLTDNIVHMQVLERKMLERLRQKLKMEIEKEYRTIEEFCYVNDIHKSTLYRFFQDESYGMTTAILFRVLVALKKKIEIV